MILTTIAAFGLFVAPAHADRDSRRARRALRKQSSSATAPAPSPLPSAAPVSCRDQAVAAIIEDENTFLNQQKFDTSPMDSHVRIEQMVKEWENNAPCAAMMIRWSARKSPDLYADPAHTETTNPDCTGFFGQYFENQIRYQQKSSNGSSRDEIIGGILRGYTNWSNPDPRYLSEITYMHLRNLAQIGPEGRDAFSGEDPPCEMQALMLKQQQAAVKSCVQDIEAKNAGTSNFKPPVNPDACTDYVDAIRTASRRPAIAEQNIEKDCTWKDPKGPDRFQIAACNSMIPICVGAMTCTVTNRDGDSIKVEISGKCNGGSCRISSSAMACATDTKTFEMNSEGTLPVNQWENLDRKAQDGRNAGSAK